MRRVQVSTYTESESRFLELPDSQEDLDGRDDYPVLHRSADRNTDRDGMPNESETMNELNRRGPDSGNRHSNGDGDTNLEEHPGSSVGEFSPEIPLRRLRNFERRNLAKLVDDTVVTPSR